MKKTQLSVLAFGTLMAVSTAVSAQRKIDMSVNLLQPTAGATITSGVPESIVLQVTNNGPDGLVQGDTLFFGIQGDQRVYPHLVASDVPNGSTYDITGDLTLNVQAAATVDLCMVVYNPNTEVMINQQPAQVSYEDDNTSNNFSCVNVTIAPGGGDNGGGDNGGDVSIYNVRSEKLALNVYPNPASTSVKFDVNANNEDVTATIKDITGREVLHQAFGKVQTKTLELNVSNLASGMYIIEVQSGAKKYSGKVTIQ